MPRQYLSPSEVKSTCARILQAFDVCCKENSLTYWIGYGTLLGAARHKGFIPWDDDIDIMMPLDSYKRLIDLVQKGTTISRYRLATHATDVNHHIWFAKVYDMETCCRQINLNRHIHANQGAWIDVFPVVGAIQPEEVTSLKASFKPLQDKITSCILDPMPRKNILAYAKDKLPGIYGRLQGGPAVFLERYDNILFDQKDPAACPILYDPAEPDVSYPSDWFYDEEPVELTFEGHAYPAPPHWEKCLSHFYGDWRRIPPENERIPHASSIWRRS